MSFKVKYYFKEELAYTEDHVLVKNLFLNDIEESLEQHQVQDYFERYGCIEKFHMYSSGNKRKRTNVDDFENGTRTGYVVFKDPRHAAEALKTELHVVSQCRITVQPSYTCLQPDAEKMPDKAENVNPPGNTAAIMKLNDYCLEHVFRELSVSDRIQFARTCYRFRNIYEEMSPMLDKLIDFEIFNEMTAWEVRNFFQLSGCNVRSIKGEITKHHCDLVCEFLGKHCINLQSLRICDDSLISYDIFKMLANLNSLQNLEILQEGLTSENLQAIEHLNQLKNLKIIHIEIGNAEDLNCLPKSIESLTLENYDPDPQPELLMKIFNGLPMLKELHLPNYTPKSPCIEQIINENGCESLETLSIGTDNYEIADYHQIARIPNLRKLILNFFRRDVDELPPMIMTCLVEHKSKQLEHFEIRIYSGTGVNADILSDIGKLSALHKLILPDIDLITDRGLESLFNLQNLTEIEISSSCEITDNGVLRLILACPKLQLLSLQDCKKLTDKLLSDIIMKLPNNQDHRPLPIKLFLYGTKVNELTLLNANVAVRNIIDVSITEIIKVTELYSFK
ncbi:F-box/LRR-repeat protein 16-like [Drosophila innubila]|uniref:F-box/LRR-repeat protein 16-like n=1 Tax=Drosophila innubila TaxID=198719 RepID=UPI00148DCB6C|nr:F-box/LRR-repeat protein 16-like [Drosophila innubila]XP_034477447.1 F-box/LRR-repeat protein 16-like [Drosophila innubila]